MEPFPTALQRLMDSHRIDQLELAAMVDMNQSTISRYLDGLRMPKPATMKRIADALNEDPAEVFWDYRQWKAKHLVEQAMAAGQIDLEDIELILAGKRYREKAEATETK